MSGAIHQGNLANRGSFRLSPNEEAAVLKEERDRRRKLRLKQVREQDRLFAKQLLARTKAKKEAEVKALSIKLEEEWKAVQAEKQQALKEIYEQCLSKVGDGHREAKNQKPMDEERAAAALKNEKAAKKRHQAAILKENAERNQKWQKENAHIIARKNALDVEKVRASHIANLPPPARDPLADLDLQKPPVMVTRVEGFSTTHYHIPGEYVERAEPHEQDDARQAAKEEDERMRGETERLQTELRERHEKASLRHKHAKEKELLKQDYERLLLELSDLQNADRRRRQAVVADIPRQVFQPPHRRLEDKVEKQHQLEEAFEDMYMKHTDYAGDITLALEPKVPGQDTDLDLTADTTRDGESEEQEVTLERPGLPGEGLHSQYPSRSAEAVQRVRPDSGTAPKPVSARAEMLKRLMGRVRGQQEDWRKQQTKAQTPVALGQPRVMPERDMHEEDVSTSQESGETDSRVSVETTPTQTTTTTPSEALATPTETLTTPTELSEHPIESVDNGSTTTSMPRSLETGTLSEVSSEAGSTLLHPMERAARIRGAQLAQQARTQEDIRAIGEEQQKRLEELKQTVHIPWENIGQSQPPLVQPEQNNRIESTKETSYLRSEFMSELMWGGQGATLEPGHPTPDTTPAATSESGILAGDVAGTSSGHPWTSERVDPLQSQRLLEEPQVQRPQGYPSLSKGPGRGSGGHSPPADDIDGMLLMRQKPTIAEDRVAVQSTSSESDVSHGQTSDGQLLDEVVHDVPGTAQETLDDGSSIDWLQRAREYQQKLLDRQRQSQESLLHAQMKLQERRERLMKSYPDVKLPDYVPYSMQSEMEGTGWQTTELFTDRMPSSFDEFQGERTLDREGQSRYDTGAAFEPGNIREQQTLDSYISPSASSGEAIEHTADSRQVGYEETHEQVGSTRFSPSKRKLDFFQTVNQDPQEPPFVPLAEDVSQTSAEESVHLSLERNCGASGIPSYVKHQPAPHGLQERSDGTLHLQATLRQEKDNNRETTAERALKIRHQQLLEEKRVLEERQNAQQLRLIQKQKELADQIEQQQRRYQERMKAAKISPPSQSQPKGPPPEHSPSIPQGILRGSGVGSQSPEVASSTEQFQSSSGIDFRGSSSQQMDMRRIMQGQVFRPQDLLHHLQGSHIIGSEPEDESDVSHLSSSRTPEGTREAGNMMMGVLKPHELLPHLQTPFTDSDGSLAENQSSSSSGLIQEQSLRGMYSAEQGTRSFDERYPLDAHPQASVLSEGTIEMDSTASPSLQNTGLAGDRFLGQVFRPADLMAELRAINQQVGMQGSFESSHEFTQSRSGEWRTTFKSGTQSGSERLDTRSGPLHITGSLRSHTASSEQSTGISYHSSHGTGELASGSGGPKKVYKELLQGHVFRPEDLLPHLQDPSSLSQSLNVSSMPEPHLSSTLAHSDTYTSPLAQRHEADGSGSEELQQSFGKLSLTRDDDTIQAASPDLDDREPIQHDHPPVSTFLPMTMPTHPAPGLHFMRSRRPPPANLQQVAVLPENMGPHELSTILEMETSADERMHLYGMCATPQHMMESTADERVTQPHFLSGTEGNLGERLPTFRGPVTGAERLREGQRIFKERSDAERLQGTPPGMKIPQDSRNSAGSVIHISQPTVAGLDGDETNLYHDTQGLRTPRMVSELQTRDLSVAASTLSEHTLDDESVTNASTGDAALSHTEGQRTSLIGAPFGSYGADANILSFGVHRGEPAGESIRWKDLLKSSDDSVASSSSDGVGRGERDTLHQPVQGDAEAEEFLPLKEMENTITTQDSIHDQSCDAKEGTSTQSHVYEQTGATQMRKHLEAGLNLDSSTSSDSQSNVPTPLIPSQESSTSSGSKLSTVIAAAVGGASSGPGTDDDSPLFVPKSSQQQEQFSFFQTGTLRTDLDNREQQRITDSQTYLGEASRVLLEHVSDGSSGATLPDYRQPEPSIPLLTPHLAVEGSGHVFPGDQDVNVAASQEEYIRDMLASLQHGKQRGITMPLFSDVSLSGYSMSQDGSVSEIRSPVKARGKASLEPIMDTSDKDQVQKQQEQQTLLEDHTFPSLGDLQMETGILEEPELTFASSLDTTADSTLQAPGLSVPAGMERHEQQGPSALDVSQSSQSSISMSLLSFQQHEKELLEASPQSDFRVTRSEGQLKVTQSLTSTTQVRITQSEGHVKVTPQPAGQHRNDLNARSQLESSESKGHLKVTHQLSRSSTQVRVTRSSGQVNGTKRTASGGQSPEVKSSEGRDKDPDRATHEPVSLQEAFQQRKKAFIRASETRKREVQEHAETRSQEATVFARTIQDWKRSKVKGQKKQATVKKTRSKTDEASTASAIGLTSTLVTRTDRNTVQKEMKERNLRLYNQLEEVQKQKMEKERQESYAANRQKKKEFEQKLQAKRAKRASSLEKTKKEK